MYNFRYLPILFVLCYFCPLPLIADSNLPSIGGSGYSVISPQQEHQLGQAWARILRGQARVYQDTVVSQYIEDLTWKLAINSQLSNHQLDVIVLDNPSINAFAIPGGIIGVHAGLLLAAQNEGQLASVLTHEIAHLSQRHYAAQLEEERRKRPLLLASIIGSLILAASSNSEGATAALQSTMAASISSRLSFSRQNEREADHIGMQNLIKAGYSANAMAEMFKQLQKISRFSQTPPEFLLTHPITQNRISDALNRATVLPQKASITNTPAFQIAKIRVEVNYADSIIDLLSSYQAQQKKKDSDYLRYAIAYAAIKAERYQLAANNIRLFSKNFRLNSSAGLLKAELFIATNKYSKAKTILKKLHSVYPDNQAINYLYALNFRYQQQPKQAIKIYRQLTEKYPQDIWAWYNLAETCGLAGDILCVHSARIEYFLRTANIDKALQQIDFAMRDSKLSSSAKAILEQRKQEAEAVRESLDMDI